MTSVALSAERGTGKSTLASVATRALGLRYVSVSGWLAHVLQQRGVTAGPDELRAAGEAAALDPARLVADCLRHACWAPGEPVLFDAVRHVEVLAALRETLARGRVLHVGLTLPPSERLARLSGRGDAPTAVSGVRHSTERQVPDLLLLADALLDASHPVATLVQDLTELVRQA